MKETSSLRNNRRNRSYVTTCEPARKSDNWTETFKSGFAQDGHIWTHQTQLSVYFQVRPIDFILFLLVVEQRRNCFPEIQSEHLLSVLISWGRRPYLSSHPAVRRWPSTNSPQKSEPRLSANLSDHVVFKAERRRCEAEIQHSPEEKEVLSPHVIVFSVGSFCGQNKEKMYWAARNTKKSWTVICLSQREAARQKQNHPVLVWTKGC